MPSFNRILEMVEKLNIPTFPLTSETVVLEDVTVEDAVTHNTRITMRVRGAGHGYSGQVDLFVTRANMIELGHLTLTQDHQFTLTEVLTQINAMAHAQLDLADVTNTDVPPTPVNKPTKLVLSARSNSLVWLGNVEVTLVVTPPLSNP